MKAKPFYSFVAIVCVLVASFGNVFAAQSPTEQLRPCIDKVTDILVNDAKVVQGEMNKVDRIMDAVKEGFDFQEMSKRVLGKKWRSLSRAEQEEFVELFTQLLKYSYVTKMEQYTNQSVEYGKQRIKGNRAEVRTLLVDADRKIPVLYIMLLHGEQWLVYDIVVEGVSLVRNYLEQFREILRKDDFAGLTHQIEMKIVELRKNTITG